MRTEILKKSTLKSVVAASTMVLSAFSLHAQATLTSFTGTGGVELVYSSVSNVTWTKDANLIKSLVGSYTSAQVVSTLNSLNGVSGITTNDIDLANGTVSSNGANAFIAYLNSISYGGSTTWRLPTVATTTWNGISTYNGTAQGDELYELYRGELGGGNWNPMPDTATFNNEKAAEYWTGTDASWDSNQAWIFFGGNGGQVTRTKSDRYYAWAVSDGNLSTSSTTPSAVPVPAAAWLFGSGLVGLAGLRRKKQA